MVNTFTALLSTDVSCIDEVTTSPELVYPVNRLTYSRVIGGFHNPCSYVWACLIHDKCIQCVHHGIGLNSKIYSKNMLSVKLLDKGTVDITCARVFP
ncbi:hypothetical protein ECG_08702 [Echinococcus granulosus]|nr:hypothetical protein ECG_08702 [Echinococcus granulosus]